MAAVQPEPWLRALITTTITKLVALGNYPHRNYTLPHIFTQWLLITSKSDFPLLLYRLPGRAKCMASFFKAKM
jgi:hypothetical protein